MSWDAITSGKFFSSGTIIFVRDKDIFMDPKDITPPEWRTSLFELNTIMGLGYKYKPDDEAFLFIRDTTLRIDLAKALLFLKSDERDFIIEKLERAIRHCYDNCEKDIFTGVMIISPPGTKVIQHLHSHRHIPNKTFTYFISSGDTENNSDLTVEQDSFRFPTAKEFYCVINTSLLHGTERHEGDNNTYIYFVFDGVTLKNPDMELNKFVILDK